MKLISLLSVVLLALTGCSGGDDAEEPVKAETETEASGEASEEAKLAAAENATEGGITEEADEANATAEVEEAEPTPDVPVATEPSGFTGPKTWKYVTAFALKVRSAPDKETSSVVRYIKKGDKIEVVIDGDWAKLGNGEYVASSRLSDNDPALKKTKPKKSKKKKQ